MDEWEAEEGSAEEQGSLLYNYAFMACHECIVIRRTPLFLIAVSSRGAGGPECCECRKCMAQKKGHEEGKRDCALEDFEFSFYLKLHVSN